MNILVIEDEESKFETIAKRIEQFGGYTSLKLSRVTSLATASRELYQNTFDLIIADLMMPPREGAPAQDVTDDLLGTLQLSDKNLGTPVVALSAFDDLVESQRIKFADAGIVLASFNTDTDGWGRQLDAALLRSREQTAFEFVLICALEKERAAFAKTAAKTGGLRSIQGLDCLELTIGTHQGVCIKLPRMGVVNAAAVTARALERFRPKLVAMSGICAGVAGQASIGTLLVADMCWEHQAGKWSETGFKPEHYDVPIDGVVRTLISQHIEADPKAMSIKTGLIEDPIIFEEVQIAPMTTGSTVIADQDRMDEIQTQHRKVAGLDMELYGLYQAAVLSSLRPIYFGAKTVVDVGDGRKSDAYHEYGCVLSARFVVNLVPLLLASPH